MKLFGLFLGMGQTMAQFSMSELITGTDNLTESLNKVAEMAEDDIQFPCLREFYAGCFRCVENVQLAHPFCLEDHPYYNPIACAIVINLCLVEELDGILKCPDKYPDNN